MHSSIKPTIQKKPNSYVISAGKQTINIKYSTDDTYKYTVIISKKQGNAVKRNRIKRVIREIMRYKRNNYPECFYKLYVNKQCDQLNRDLLLNDIEEIIKKITSIT